MKLFARLGAILLLGFARLDVAQAQSGLPANLIGRGTLIDPSGAAANRYASATWHTYELVAPTTCRTDLPPGTSGPWISGLQPGNLPRPQPNFIQVRRIRWFSRAQSAASINSTHLLVSAGMQRAPGENRCNGMGVTVDCSPVSCL
jgi:hypothetical protein